MKIYKVKVNGKVYEVELEKVTENDNKIVVENNQSAPVSNGSGQTINAPLQGKVFNVLVKVGDKINSGDTVIVLEAMKMENEVQTSLTGTVKEILVSVGNDVETDQPLIVIE